MYFTFSRKAVTGSWFGEKRESYARTKGGIAINIDVSAGGNGDGSNSSPALGGIRTTIDKFH
jgi:hypothetical protein